MILFLEKLLKSRQVSQNFQRFRSFFLLFLFTFLFTGCATIINTPNQKIVVTSSPSKAIVSDGISYWTTPATIILSRKEDHPLFIWKPGYKIQAIHLKHMVSATILGDALIPGGLVFAAIDVASGSEYKLVPGEIDVKLRPVNEDNGFYPAPF